MRFFAFFLMLIVIIFFCGNQTTFKFLFFFFLVTCFFTADYWINKSQLLSRFTEIESFCVVINFDRMHVLVRL